MDINTFEELYKMDSQGKPYEEESSMVSESTKTNQVSSPVSAV